MTEITQLLEIDTAEARAEVFARLYPELKKIAQARLFNASHRGAISATVLVHESFLKLVGSANLSLSNRKHFFACAAMAMRQILLDHYKSAQANADRERPEQPNEWTLSAAGETDTVSGLCDLDRALQELQSIDPRLVALLELRYFAGLSMPEIAEIEGVSLRTAMRDWARARAHLQARLSAYARV